jgi:pimeloyl-ACP methyl ester carboxylesterase
VGGGYREFRFKSHDGLDLHSRLYEGPQHAPVVLCLHGLTRNSRDFELLAPQLQSRYRIIVPDVRGRGLSARDPNSDNYQANIYIQDLLTLLDLLAISRVALIGTSMGGILGMMLGYLKPERLVCLVLNDVGPEFDPKGIERIKRYAGRLPAPKGWDEAVAQTRSVFGDAWRKIPEARWLELARRAYREDEAGRVVSDADPTIGEVMRRAPPGPADLWPLWSALKKIPILSLRGAHSDILSAATVERMQREKPDLEVLSVADRGHVPLLDEPEVLLAIDNFLARTFAIEPIPLQET